MMRLLEFWARKGLNGLALPGNVSQGTIPRRVPQRAKAPKLEAAQPKEREIFGAIMKLDGASDA